MLRMTITSCVDRGCVSRAEVTGLVDPRAVRSTCHWEDMNMRYMVMVRANKESEAGVMPDTKILAAMGKFNEELVKAGVMLAGEGLAPSSQGARVSWKGGKPVVTDGPFAETKELIAGFWLWQVKSKDEALEWLRRSPFG